MDLAADDALARAGRARLRDHRPRRRAGTRRVRRWRGCGRAATSRRRQWHPQEPRGWPPPAARPLPSACRSWSPACRPCGRATGAPATAPRRHRCCRSPAIRRWSMSAALSGARRPAIRRASVAPESSLPSGSMPTALKCRDCIEPGARHQIHQAEAPRIVEDDAHARRHVKDDVVVGAELGGCVIIGARHGGGCRPPRCGRSPTCRDA